MSRGFLAAAVLAGCLMLQACAGGQRDGAPIILSRETNDHLQAYLGETDAGRMGAFAVSEDGSAAFYSICESGSCNGQYNFSADAIKGCEKFGHGRCVVLASNGVIKRAYKVAGSSGS